MSNSKRKWAWIAGAACCGKGTLIRDVNKLLQPVPFVLSMSAGLVDLKKDPVIGGRVASEMKLGLHVYHEAAARCFWQETGKITHGEVDVIGDGCLRTPRQAIEYMIGLRAIIPAYKFVAIYLDTPADVCLERMRERAYAEGRPDDNEHSMAVRMHLHEYVERAALDQLSGMGVNVHRIDGTLSRAERAAQALAIIRG